MWLNQSQNSYLFGTSVQNISYHIANILTEKELDANSVVKDYLITASDGKKYDYISISHTKTAASHFLRGRDAAVVRKSHQMESWSAFSFRLLRFGHLDIAVFVFFRNMATVDPCGEISLGSSSSPRARLTFMASLRVNVSGSILSRFVFMAVLFTFSFNDSS